MTDFLDGPAASIIGQQVVTEDNACKCGCDIAIVRAGRAMHAAGLLCLSCGKFRQWLSHEAVENFADLFLGMKRKEGLGQPDVIRIRTKRIPAQPESVAGMGEPATANAPEPQRERPQSMKMSEQFPSKFLKAADLRGQDVKVILQNVVSEKVGDDTKPVLYFKGKEKGMVINVTNKNTLVDLYGDDSADWVGKPAVLFEAMVEFQGKRMPGIRIRGLTARDTKKADPISTGSRHDPDMSDDIPFDM